jgi:pimeloyl-ACP methyl ester carboxylesterase
MMGAAKLQGARARKLFGFKPKYMLCITAVALAAGCGGSGGDSPPGINELEVSGCEGTVKYAEADGTFENGTPWGMRRPAGWTGLLINDLDYVPGRDTARSCYWLKRGYAISGTGRNPQRSFNYDPEREAQELMSVIDKFGARYGKPARVVQYGHSGGGFVALNLAERYSNRVDGVVAGCAHEQVPLMNMMLDGWFVLRTLIAPELQIVGFNDLATVTDQANKWKAALAQAQQTPEGRARIALAAAVGQWPVWSSATKAKPDFTDATALQTAVYETVLLNAGQPGGQSRFMSEHAGTSPTPRQLSWNNGIDYGQLLARADPVLGRLVQSLYAAPGADLQKDLEKLRDAQRVQADPAAVAFWDAPGRTVHGNPKVPVLRFHTTGDNVVPPQLIDDYVQKMRANNGDVSLYRTAVVERTGHCTFDASESAAAVETLLSRLNTGAWPDVSPEGMNARAKALIPGSTPLFVPYTPVPANRPHNNPSGGL